MEALEQGAIKARGAINHVSGRTVTFATGERETVDVIYFATGYRLSYPYVEQSVLDTADNDMVLYRGLMHPDRRTLFVVGVSRPSGGFWPVAEAQAQFVAQLLSGAYRLPGSAEIERATGPVLRRDSFNPALYGLALREELARGARRAERS